VDIVASGYRLPGRADCSRGAGSRPAASGGADRARRAALTGIGCAGDARFPRGPNPAKRRQKAAMSAPAEPSAEAERPSPFAPSIREFLSYLKVEAGLSPATLEAYARDLRDLSRHFDALGLAGPAAVTPEHVAAHFRHLHRERGLEPASIVRHFATVRVYFRYLHANRRIESDPSRLAERPTTWKRLPGVLSPNQMRALVQAPSPEHGTLWLRDRAILELMWAAGLRASEVGTLKVNEFNDTLCMVTVTGKGSKQRVVPIGTPAQELLRQYLAEFRPHLCRFRDGRDRFRLFLSHTGRPLERVALWQIVRKYAAIAGLRDVHPHLLRHSFATHLVSGGADLRVVQELLGHSDIGTTQVYTHVDRSRLRDVVRKHHPRFDRPRTSGTAA